MRPLVTFFSGLLMLFVVTLTHTSEVRTLTPTEESQLRDFAEQWINRFSVMRSERFPIDVWRIESSVYEEDGVANAHADVVFRPAATRRHCLAPHVQFVGTSRGGAGSQFKWETVPQGASAIAFRFWFDSCDAAEPGEAVHLGQVLDFDVLNKIRGARETIMDGIREHYESRDVGAVSEWELESIDIHYSPDDGVIYHLRYFQNRYSGLWANVVFEAQQVRVIDSGPLSRGSI